MNKKITKNVSLIIALLTFTYCADQIVESTPSIDENVGPKIESATFTNIQSAIFNQSCASSGCHVSGSVNPNLAGNSYNIIVNKKSSTGLDYIKPNDPKNSYLLQKIIGSNGIQGSRMPLNSSPLSQEKIDIVTEWINNGAKND